MKFGNQKSRENFPGFFGFNANYPDCAIKTF